MANAQDMTQGSPRKLIWRFALPMMTGNVFQLAYSIVDSAVVGRLIGVSAFAAVGVTAPLYWLMLSIVLGMEQGFGALMAQRFGAGDARGLKRALGSAATLTIIMGIIMSACGAIFTRSALEFINTPSEIIGMAALYLSITSGAMLLTAIYNLLGALLRALGDSRTPLVALIISTALNIVLDIALVKWTALGVAGVAVATVISQLIAILYCVWALRNVPQARITARDMAFNMAEVTALLRLGVPSALRNGIASIGGLAIQNAVNGYGALFVAGIALPSRLFGLMEIIASALEGAIAVFVAQNFGAGKIGRIKDGVRSTRNAMLISSVAIAALLFAFGMPLMRLLVSGEGQDAVLEIARKQLIVTLIGLPSLYLLVMYRAALIAIDRPLVPMITGFIELGVRLLCALVLVRVIGEWGVYMAESAGWPVAMLPVVIVYYRNIRKQRLSVAHE